MKPSIYRISLDVHDAHSSVCLDMKRQDTARQIDIALTDGGFPYRISEECYAVFAATKADGKKLLHHCEIRNNIIQYIVRPQTTAAIGLMECEIKLYGANDKLLFSPGFNILVSENAVTDDDDLISEDEVDELTHLISEAAKVIAEGKEVNAESSALIDDMEAKRETLDQQIQETGTAAANAQRHAQLASQASQSASNSSSIAYNRAQDAQTAAGNAKTSENNAKTSAQTAVNMANAALQSQRAAEAAAQRAEEAAEQAGNGSNSGQNAAMTTAQINALDALFNVVSFNKEDVSAEYNAFREAFGLKVLSSISATYSGGNVTVGTAVSALTGIVVTAHYSDSSTETITGYTLSGTIAEGSNTITVGYGGMTTTFAVIGVYEAGTFTITNDLTNVTNSNAAKTITEGEPYTATLTAKDGYELTAVTVTMDGEDITATAYSGGVVSISSVTGNVVITASAAEKAAEIFEPESNTAVSVTLDQANTLLDPGTGTTSGNASWIASDYAEIPVGYDYVVFQCDKTSNIRYALYDSEKQFIRGSTLAGVTATVQEVGAENAAYIRLSNNKTVESVSLTFGKNMVTSWGDTDDNYMNSDGTITEGYTGGKPQRISKGYVKIPTGASKLIWGNRSGYSYRQIAVSVYDAEYSFVSYGYLDQAMPVGNGAMDLTANPDAVYMKAAAWDNSSATNNNPAEQIIFGYY